MLGTIAIWIGIVSGTVIIAGGVIGVYRCLAGRGKVREHPRLASVLTIEEDERWWIPQRGGPVLGKYLGIKFSNISDQQDVPHDVQNCRIRLESLEYWGDSTQAWFRPPWFNPLLLAWSFNDGGGAEKTIGAGSSRSCDLVCYESQEYSHATIVAAEHRLRPANHIWFGRWHVRCHVEADGWLPVDLDADLIWQPRDTEVGQLRTLEFTSLRVLELQTNPREQP